MNRSSLVLLTALVAAACIPQVTGCSSNDAPSSLESNVTSGAKKPPTVKFLVNGGKLHAIVTQKTSPSAVLYVRMRRTGGPPPQASSTGTRTQALTEEDTASCDDIQTNGTAIPLSSAAPISGEDGMTLVGGPAVSADLLHTVYPPNSAGQNLASLIGDNHTAIVEGCVVDGTRLLGVSAEELADAADDGSCGLPVTGGGAPSTPTGGPSGDGGPPSNPDLKDSCLNRSDGVYCSQLDKASAIVCKDGQISSGQQCIDGKLCSGPNGGGDQIECTTPPSPDGNASFKSVTVNLNGAGSGLLRPRAFVDGVYTCTAPQLKGKKAYTDACEKALGEMPMFKKKPDGTHERFSCVGNKEMKLVPVARTEGGTTTTIDESVKGALTAAQKQVAEQCDQPAWLGYGDKPGAKATQCAPYTRAGLFKSSKAEFMVICRRYAVRGQDETDFDDINIIGHNESTGDTCFWNTHLKGVDSKKGLPHPSEDVATDAKWMTVGDVGSVNCVACHDADPWMHSPWIDQLGILPNNPTGKYKIVAGDSLEKEGGGGEWNKLEALDEPDAKPCTSCHRIGKYQGPAAWVPRATGQSITTDAWWSFTSDFARTYEQNRWMPEGSAPAEANWPGSKYDKAVKKIMDCTGSKAASCKWRKI